MEDKIKNASLSFTCDQDWNNMKDDTDGRFCGGCQKKVYDMTDKNVAYFIKVMQENNNQVCGRFTKDQMALPATVELSWWKRWTVAAMVLMGLGTMTKNVQAQSFPLGKMLPPAPKPAINIDDDHGMLLGEVVVVGMPPQIKAIHNYLVKHCRVSPSTNGRLAVSFAVAEDGSLTQIALTEQLSAAVNLEVLRVLKKAPKWKNYNRETNSFYDNTLYLTFVNGKIKGI